MHKVRAFRSVEKILKCKQSGCVDTVLISFFLAFAHKEKEKICVCSCVYACIMVVHRCLLVLVLVFVLHAREPAFILC